MRGSSDTQQIQNSFSHMELCGLMLRFVASLLPFDFHQFDLF
ncbi:hypothetical protein LINPERPRIM_LOCUS13396 [Linum perenne]